MVDLNFISPCWIVEDLEASVGFYVNMLGFEVLYTGPDESPFWAMVGRGPVALFLKAVDVAVKPIPNKSRHEWAPWDAYISVAEPDELYAEYQSRGVSFRRPIGVDGDNLRGFEVADADGYVLFFGRPWP